VRAHDDLVDAQTLAEGDDRGAGIADADVLVEDDADFFSSLRAPASALSASSRW